MRRRALSGRCATTLRAGTVQVWVVYPRLRQVVVHEGREARTVGMGETLEGGAVLPGFSVAVADIFRLVGGGISG